MGLLNFFLLLDPVRSRLFVILSQSGDRLPEPSQTKIEDDLLTLSHEDHQNRDSSINTP